jgi:hypothetical protein
MAHSEPGEADGLRIGAMHARRHGAVVPVMKIVQEGRTHAARDPNATVELPTPVAPHGLEVNGGGDQRHAGFGIRHGAQVLRVPDDYGCLTIGLEDDESEGRKLREIHGCKTARCLPACRCADYARNYQSTAERSPRRCSIQQAEGYAVLIHADPRATMIGVDGCDAGGAFGKQQARRQSLTARQLLIAVAEQLVFAGFVQP